MTSTLLHIVQPWISWCCGPASDLLTSVAGGHQQKELLGFRGGGLEVGESRLLLRVTAGPDSGLWLETHCPD